MSTDEEARIEEGAKEFARKRKQDIAKKLTDPEIFPPGKAPVSVFMAGSPLYSRWDAREL